MLKEFSVENFKSIKKEQTFTMEACSKNEVSEYPEHVIEIGNERLLKVASMYGPNGGGKSNLFKAMNAFAAVIVNAPLFNDSLRDENYYPSVFLKNKNTKFSFFFVNNEYEIGYSLEVNLNKVKQAINQLNNAFYYVVDYQIVKEELVARKLNEQAFVSVYTRNSSGIVSSDALGDIDLIKNKMQLNMNNSFINYYCSTFANANNIGIGKAIFALYNEVNSYAVLTKDLGVIRISKQEVEYYLPFLEKTKNALNKLDFRIEKLYFKEAEPGAYYLYVVRKTDNGSTEIPLNNESLGTIKAINILLGIYSRKQSHLFIVDDFDSFLHPKLVKVIVELFTSKDNVDKQLIINSHDIINMNNKVFRRDEIWFAYRDQDYSTVYTPLSSIVDYKGNMVRKDAVYGKQYLEGRYGADPFIEKGLSWNND